MSRFYIILICLFFATCSSGIPEPSFDYKETEKGLSNEADPEDLTTIMAGGPLLTLSTETDNPTLKSYRELRNARVDEMIGMMEDQGGFFEEVLDEMPQYRELVMRFLGFLSENLDTKDPRQARLRLYVLDTVDRFADAVIKTTARQSNLEGLLETLEEMDEESAAMKAMFWHSYFYQCQLLIQELTYELSYFSGRLVGFVAYIQNDEKRFSWWSMRRKINNYEDDIENFLENIQEPFQRVILNQLDIAMGFQMLEGGDYAITMATLEYVQGASGEIKKMVDRTPVREGVSADDKDYYTTYAEFLKVYSDTALSDLKKVREPRVLIGMAPTYDVIPYFGFGVAHAGVTDWLGKAATSMKESIQGAGNYAYGAVSNCAASPWQCTKKSFQNTQKAIGMSVDAVNMAVGASMDVGMNVYYGNSCKDIQDITGGNMVKMFKSWDEGKMGSTVLKTARDYLDGAEKGVGQFTENMTKNVFGDGYVSWGAGKLGEMTTNMATGLGKGMMALANTQSTGEELVEGALDVAFSFTGGSKSVVKGSQLMKGSKKLANKLAKKGIQQMEKMSLKMQKQSLRNSTNTILKTAAKKLNKAELQIIYSNTKTIVANEAKEKILKKTEEKVLKIMSDTMKKSGKKVWGNLKGVPGNIKDFTMKKFDFTLKGFKDSSKEIFGGSLREWGNNIFANLADTEIKNYAKSLVPADDKREIANKEDVFSDYSAFPVDNPALSEMLKDIAQVVATTDEALEMVDDLSDKVAQDKVAEEIQKTVVDTAVEQANKELSKRVSANGVFTGSYSGSVTLSLVPAGGNVIGTVTTRYGNAGVTGNVTKDGFFKAKATGSLKYEDWDGEWKNCNLKARMTGRVYSHRASGTYSGKCAKEGDSGSWSVTW